MSVRSGDVLTMPIRDVGLGVLYVIQHGDPRDSNFIVLFYDQAVQDPSDALDVVRDCEIRTAGQFAELWRRVDDGSISVVGNLEAPSGYCSPWDKTRGGESDGVQIWVYRKWDDRTREYESLHELEYVLPNMFYNHGLLEMTLECLLGVGQIKREYLPAEWSKLQKSCALNIDLKSLLPDAREIDVFHRSKSS